MINLIKSIPLNNGELFVTTGGNRYHLASFDGVLEIKEEQSTVPVL